MTELEWDKIGERFFETGIDRGVLFTTDGNAVAWNGLTQVTENTEREVKSYWLDGVKYLDHHVPGSYSAKLEAFTYPDELDDITGVGRFAPGVYLHDQPARMFHLSYRTGVGSDIDSALGYKLHIVYNIMAVPASAGIGTIGDNVEPGKFSWDLSGTPPLVYGARPTSHVHLDSRYINAAALEAVEELLYGTDTTDPELPDMVTLLGMVGVT